MRGCLNLPVRAPVRIYLRLSDSPTRHPAEQFESDCRLTRGATRLGGAGISGGANESRTFFPHALAGI
jgi:hypothetical protein